MESITHFGIPLFLLPFAHVMCFFPMLNTFPLFYVLKTGKKAFVMSSHFMKKLMDNGYDGVRRWYRKVAYRRLINWCLITFSRNLGGHTEL